MSKLCIVYWSSTGHTCAMAEAIADGAEAGGAEVELNEVGMISIEAILGYDVIALGCPAMGNEVLEEDEFEPFYVELESKLRGKTLALFGSYDWGDGEWMRDWVERAKDAGVKVYGDEGLIVQTEPDADGLLQCEAWGKALAALS